MINHLKLGLDSFHVFFNVLFELCVVDLGKKNKFDCAPGQANVLRCLTNEHIHDFWILVCRIRERSIASLNLCVEYSASCLFRLGEWFGVLLYLFGLRYVECFSQLRTAMLESIPLDWVSLWQENRDPPSQLFSRFFNAFTNRCCQWGWKSTNAWIWLTPSRCSLPTFVCAKGKELAPLWPPHSHSMVRWWWQCHDHLAWAPSLLLPSPDFLPLCASTRIIKDEKVWRRFQLR